MRPEDETPDDDVAEGPDPQEPAGAVPPATWAGRQRAGGDEEPPPADEPAEDDPVEDEPAEDDPADEPAEDDPVEDEAAEGAPAEAEEDFGETVEAETLALADREAAQEAAIAGLRARTGEHPAEGEEPVEAEEEAEIEPDPELHDPAERFRVVAATAAGDDDGKPARAKRVWPRFLAASFVIVASVAAATAVSALVFLADFARGLGGIEGVSERLDAVEGGDPQTILILGSDKRPTDDTGRSDTTILLRVDPDNQTLNLLSIPRDLKVNIPRYGVAKFNEAYSVGGPPLTLETVKRLTGLEINHVVNVNFNGFADAVNSIGCVFIDVDRRYFVPEESEYSAIDPPIEPGYQKLCGLKALQYVRFRLDDTDLVRSARQQDFVREARQKISPARLVLDTDYRFELLDVFKQYTTSDDGLKDPIEVLELMKTFLAARKAGLNEVHFPADLGDGTTGYVTASEEGIRKAVDEFLGSEGTPGPQDAGDDKPQRGGGNPDQPKPDKPKPDKPEPPPEPEPAPEPSGPAMIDVAAVSEQYADRIAKSERNDGKPLVRFPVFYPTRLTEGSSISEVSRAFPIDGPSKYFGYKFVVSFQQSTVAYQEYYGVSGTNWEDPPILENPSETRRIEGRDYLVFYDGDRVRLVGFKEGGRSYWVHNSLLQTLTEEEMISIATSMRERGG